MNVVSDKHTWDSFCSHGLKFHVALGHEGQQGHKGKTLTCEETCQASAVVAGIAGHNCYVLGEAKVFASLRPPIGVVS